MQTLTVVRVNGAGGALLEKLYYIHIFNIIIQRTNTGPRGDIECNEEERE